MKLREEMDRIIQAFDREKIPYALCGGLAMAVHGWPRATLDIDIMIEEPFLEPVRKLAKSLGYRHESGFVSFASGRIRMLRIVKFEGDEFLPLDILLVTPQLENIWKKRQQLDSKTGTISVVSSSGLIEMKKMRGNGIDQDDIRNLEGKSNEPG
jgi:hypothetical protein